MVSPTQPTDIWGDEDALLQELFAAPREALAEYRAQVVRELWDRCGSAWFAIQVARWGGGTIQEGCKAGWPVVKTANLLQMR